MAKNDEVNEALTKFIGARLKEARRSRDITQVQAASSLDLTHSAIGQWERGETLPGLLNLIFIAEIYSTSLDRLIFGTDSDMELRIRQLPESLRETLLKQWREQLKMFEQVAAEMPEKARNANGAKQHKPISWLSLFRAASMRAD